MTPRGTDWGLALLVTVLFVSGVWTWFSGDEGDAWIFSVHSIAAAALALLLIWKLRRVATRVFHAARWDRRTIAGALALLLVAATLATGWIWIAAGKVSIAGFTLIAWHTALGALLTLVVLTHLALRAKRPRRRDVVGRRQFLEGAAIGAGGILIWQLQGPASRALGLPGAKRRFTGSYETESFSGNEFPTTSWVADDPQQLEVGEYRLKVEGLVSRPLELPASALQRGDELIATLDCTGGFYSTQRWGGIWLAALLDRAQPLPDATHVRVISHTGYRWSFDLDDARELLIATHVEDEPLSHGHGAPARLVAPDRRGFQWVKWVTRLELSDQSDWGAFPSTVWSSFTAEGRGEA